MANTSTPKPDACGGTIIALNGTITSPSFPDFYPMSKECTWDIIVPKHYKIMLNVTHFDLEGNNYIASECDYDSLTIYSKVQREDNLRRYAICDIGMSMFVCFTEK